MKTTDDRLRDAVEDFRKKNPLLDKFEGVTLAFKIGFYEGTVAERERQAEVERARPVVAGREPDPDQWFKDARAEP